MSQSSRPFFSVIMPTRDRFDLFKLALDSVLSQKFENLEIHVVNDGSSGEYLEKYKKLESEYAERVIFHYLVYRPNGHGQSYSMNFGASQATGDYLCFLDDDDFWVDDEHLSRAAKSILASEKVIDLYYTNQKAFFSDGRQNTSNVWIEDLESRIQHLEKDSQGCCVIDVDTLLGSDGFAHLNCSIFRSEFYAEINGMDEHIRYECDRDIYIRSIDAARHILHNPVFVAQHHIPDPKKSDNMSTIISIYEKKIFQLRVYDKGVLLCKKPKVITLCKTGKGNELKKITEALYQTGRYSEALFYAREALGALPTMKWFLFTLIIFVKNIIN